MKILHLDIETAPNKVYCWGLWNQNVAINQIEEPGYTMCWAAKWHGQKEVMFRSMQEHGFENMLQGIFELMCEADVLVHYNGNKFDIPTLNKEFLLYDIGVPDPSHQVDLLQVVKKRFRFPSNKLDYIAQQLGLGSKVSHKGMDLWRECMDGEEKSWKIMERYNKQDVVLLEKVYKVLLPWIQNHPNHALYMDQDRPVCPNCGSHHVHKKGTETTKTGKYQRYKCTSCGTPLRGRHSLLKAEESKNVLTQSKL